MRRIRTAIARHAVLLAALAVTWILVVGYASATSNGGLAWPAVWLALGMCGVAGAVASVIAPARAKLYAGALGGTITIFSYFAVAFGAALVSTGGVVMTPESLAELPSWLVGLSLIGAIIGLVGGVLAAALTHSIPPRTDFSRVFLLGVALFAMLLFLLSLPGLLYGP